jgi:P4 family phage/plasmid primase-like protien
MSECAAAYSQAGWCVVPLHEPQATGCSCGDSECGKPGKHARISAWQKVSCDLASVEGWWKTWPNANVGLRLDRLLVLDVDGALGLESLREMERDHGVLEARARQRSGSGGWHYLFEAVSGVQKRIRFRPGLDLLTGAGCYVVAAPSLHVSGGRYEWTDEPHPLSTHRDAIQLFAPPQWLLAAASTQNVASTHAGKKAFSLPAEIGEGRRDTILTSAAGKMRRASFNEDEILAALRQMNQERCKPPLPDTEVERIAKSIGKKEPAPVDEEAGLTKGLASAITANEHFAQDRGKLLYHFEDGVYRPTGERFIEKQVKALCEDWQITKSWSPELANRVYQWIRVDAPELWEQPPLDILNVRNGLLNVTNRSLLPHSPSHLSAVQIAVTFDPQATCQEIDKFICDVFPDDSRHLPYEVAAWLMLPDTSIQKAILTLGEGANGKSVWLSLLLGFLGRENVSTLSLHRIEADKFAAARLVGKLCNIGTDLPTAALAGTSMFKALTGGDTITAERKFESSFEFRPFARLMFSANSAPRSEDATHGFFRRWLVIPFNRTFDEADPNTVPRAVLDARLSQPGELSGMLNRALDALPAIRTGRFTESDSTRAALDEFRRTTDPLAVWLDQCTLERPDAVIAKDKLRSVYSQVCQDNGRPIMGDVQFSGALKRLRPKVEPAKRRVDGKLTPVYVGLGLVTQDQVPVGLF